MIQVKPVKDEKSYKEALDRFSEIFDAKIGTAESDEADVLAVLIEDYENKHFPIEAPDPIEAIKIRMEDLDLQQKDLIPILGQKSSRVALSLSVSFTLPVFMKLMIRF
jgi:HTH-type transcriptional regulator / antitoxin HigA